MISPIDGVFALFGERFEIDRVRELDVLAENPASGSVASRAIWSTPIGCKPSLRLKLISSAFAG
jgi:hypothetical protein